MDNKLAKEFTLSSLLQFAVPSILMMLCMSLYTIVDGIFISRFVGTDALSASNIVFPYINVLMGVAIMLGTGSSAIVARKMGEGRLEEAKNIFTFISVVTIVFGVVTALAVSYTHLVDDTIPIAAKKLRISGQLFR